MTHVVFKFCFHYVGVTPASVHRTPMVAAPERTPAVYSYMGKPVAALVFKFIVERFVAERSIALDSINL